MVIDVQYGSDAQKSSPREHKGHYCRSIELCNYTVIDIETTGLDPRYCEIIELGAIRYREGVEETRFQSLVKPVEGISDFIEKLTGITNEMVSDAPALKDILPEFRSFVGNDVVLGHNVNFDINFIYDAAISCNLSPFSNDYADTMLLSRLIFKDEHKHRLVDVCNRLNVSQPEEHRAIADCIRTHLAYQSIKQYCVDMDIHLQTTTKSSWGVPTHAKSISAQTDIFNEEGPVYQKVFAFTGALDKMTRKEAMQSVVDCGGIIGDNVTQKTNFLVLGNNDYCKSIKDGKSRKQKKAENLQLEGFDIVTISEDVFYDMLQDSILTGLDGSDSNINQ